ncbi:mucin-21 [Calliphora vicina]|uniref:mucin-21 n=1 Tax=Calliphora vicina TaxID=7373 RepID=UPI00325BDFBA
MDTLSPHKNSKQSSSSSSGCSASSSTTDIKNSYKSQRLDNKPAGMRSRSFLHCLSKHLGRHFIHHHPHHHTVHQNGQTIVYNSQEELRSSSTDSFSLSYERNSRLDGMQQNNSNGTGTSSFDISSEERTSRASSTSACSRFSPEQEDMENGGNKIYNNKQHHIYISTTIYRPSSSLDCHDDLEEDYSESDSGNSSSDETEANNLQQNQENIYNQNDNNSKSKSSPASVENTPSSTLTTSAAKGLHLSRISITSSVRSIFQHISSVSASSTRSLSCSSTPLKRVWDSKCKKSNSSPASSSSASNSGKSNKSSTRSSASNSSSSNSSSSKKTEKKQQSILRPPVNYVYMKGMSGLYSRVPRYSVCCPYGTQQWA